LAIFTHFPIFFVFLCLNVLPRQLGKLTGRGGYELALRQFDEDTFMKRLQIAAIIGLMLAIPAALGFYWRFSSTEPGIRLHGTVEIQEVRLSSKIGGRIKAVLVDEGALVEAGQPIVELEAPELEAQRRQVQARIQAADAQYEKALSGARVEEKAVALAAAKAAEARWRKLEKGYRLEEVTHARSELASADAELAGALQRLEREKSLYPRATSKAEFDAAITAVGRWQGTVSAARAKAEMMTQGYRAEEIAEAKAEWERAQANWQLVEAGTRSEDLAELEARIAELKGKLQELDVQLREATVIAPERVRIEVLAVRRGDVVAPNQPVTRVLRADDLWVRAFVPEIELGKIRLHQKVFVTCDSFPGKRFEGQLVHIASSSEFTPRNVQSYDERRHQVFAVKIRVTDPSGVFKSGMAAEVWLPTE